MKLRLNHSLRKAVMTAFAIAATAMSWTWAGVMHEDATYATYSDFGQNRGRYATGRAENALLQYIRQKEGGIGIEYTDGTQTYYISNEQGMIDFSGVHDQGHSGLVSVNTLATVLHNGSLNASFTEDDLGAGYAQNYSVLDIRGSDKFRLGAPAGSDTYDYMLQRQTRIVTDAVAAPVTTVDVTGLTGQHMYHAGAGIMGVYNETTQSYVSLAGPYNYVVGDIVLINGATQHAGGTNTSIFKDVGYGNGIGASLENPLPNATRGGDSGSPVYIYNQATGQYEYVAAHQSGNGRSWGQARGDHEWTHAALEAMNVHVSLDSTGEARLGAVDTQGATITDNKGNSATLYTGTVSTGAGSVSFNGVQDGQYTWRDMSSLKDQETWYVYDAGRYNANSNADGLLNQDIADLFYTENLVFTPTRQDNAIILDATVDMGAGYMEFRKGELDSARFTITGEGRQLHTAGYVVGDGVNVHLQLTNPADYMTEWRKTGTGTLHIDGTGNTNALLNLGGTGATYLNQQGGYAAYNVLVNTGARVVIGNTAQIARDFTFGYGGGELDLNGNSMDWYTTGGETRDGFTINALTDEALISNSAGHATLTFRESGDMIYKGSFSDSGDGSLEIDYQGGGHWTLHSIHTDLTHADSGLTVSQGMVTLAGTHTVHGTGSATGRNKNRYLNTMDWHYADARMDVTVKDQATFELGSHARLTGTVTVQSGGTFIMREGVQHAMEYIEGGTKLQSTADIAAFHGLKGDVVLESGSHMRVEYGAGVTTDSSYSGNISGAGNLTIDTGSADRAFTLAGDNSFSGTKTLVTGGLVAHSNAALGDTTTHRWQVGGDAWLASHGFEEGTDILSFIDGSSTGTLALSNDLTTQLDLAGHQHLYLGAESGRRVSYGAEGTTELLRPVDRAWHLGGGGGELVVNFKLSGNNDLMLGASAISTGAVYLANSTNDFTGNILFAGSGVKLDYAAGALGNAMVNLTYGNGMVIHSHDDLARVQPGAEGFILLDKIGDTGLDVRAHAGLALSAAADTRYAGGITLAEGQAYRFSAMNGATLTLKTALAAGHDIIVDAQGTTGGKVVLGGNDTLSNNISIYGNRNSGATGDITLALGQDMHATGTLSLGQGGHLDIAGHTLTLSGDLTGGTGSIEDSSGSGQLVFDTTAGHLTADAVLNADTVRVSGGNSLRLGGTHGFNTMHLEAGRLELTGDLNADSGSMLYLEGGTTLDLQGRQANLTLGMSKNAGVATVTTAAGSTVAFSRDIVLGKGSRLNLTGASGYAFNGAAYGGEGSEISLQSGELRFDTVNAVDIRGTLSVEQDMRFFSNGNASDMERNIDTLQINNGAKLTLAEQHWSTVWNIGSLNGSGQLLWDSTTNHFTTSRLILSREGDFTGTISLDRRNNNAARTHGAFIELAHDRAAQNAAVQLLGSSADSHASLAINTENAQIKGLSGNEFSYVYAGASMVDAELSGTARPATTRQATLDIHAEAGTTHTYSGTLGHSTDTSALGLSLEKHGAGTQIFSGTTSVNHIMAHEGTLQIAAAGLSHRGNAGVGYGAGLDMGDFTLSTGREFAVLSGGAGTGSASFAGQLALAGGSLSFSGEAMTKAAADNTVALQLGSLHTAGVSSQSIRFTDTSALQAGRTYTLASGDWSTLVSGITAEGLHYYDAGFAVAGNGNLQVSLTLKDNCFIWDGGESTSNWSSTRFGSQATEMNASVVAVFDDNADSRQVYITGDSTNGRIVFNATGDYALEAAGGVVTTGEMVIMGGGSVSIDAGLRITGNTNIQEGTLIVKDAGALGGTVSGNGTLVLDVEYGSVAPTIQGLDTLHIKSGAFGAANSKLPVVKHIIVDAGARYAQGGSVHYTGDITSRGGKLEFVGGSLDGTLTLEGDTVIDVTSTDTVLKSELIDNGYSITQTAFKGSILLNGTSKATLNHYIVSSGTLKFGGGIAHSGHGTLTVNNSGALQIQGNTSLNTERLNLNNTATVTLQGGASLITDIVTSGTTSVSLTNASTSLKGSISGSGSIALNGTGTVQSVISDAAAPLEVSFSNANISLLAANTHSGGTTIHSGKVYARNAHALGTGTVTVNQGGTLVLDLSGLSALSSVSALNLNGGILDASVGSASIVSGAGLMLGGALSATDGSCINLGNLSGENTIYTVFRFDGETAGIEDWAQMHDRLMVNGELLTGREDVTLGLSENAATLMFGTAELRWQGESAGAWNLADASWDATPGVANDNMAFANMTHAAFDRSATLEVERGIAVADLRLGEGVQLTTSGTIHITGNIVSGADSRWTLAADTNQMLTENQLQGVNHLVVDNGASLAVLTEGMAGYNKGNLSGEGTVSLALSQNYGNTLQLGSSFNGETHVRSGYFTITGATVGKTLRLAGGVNMQSLAKGTVTADIIMEGTHEVHANSGRPITYNGSITGENGVFISAGTSAHTFNGAVSLAEFRTKASAAVTFNSRVALDTLTVQKGSVTFADKATLGSVNQSGGSIRLAAGAEVNVTRELRGSAAGAVALENGASLKLKDIEFTNRGDSTATLQTSADGAAYSAADTQFELTGGHLKSTASTATTLNTKLTRASVENAGSGLLTVNGAANTLTGIAATGGSVQINGAAQQLSWLDIGSAHSIISQSPVAVSGLASFAAGSRLVADFELLSGATLEIGQVSTGGVKLEGTLTLNSGLMLGEQLMSSLQNLQSGQVLTLFSGLDTINIDGAFMNDRVLISELFSNVEGADSLYLTMALENSKLSLQVMHIPDQPRMMMMAARPQAAFAAARSSEVMPEPTTATLSLLALIGLAIRRRRK